MNLTALIIQLISGAIGGNAAGAVSKNTSLGPVGDTIAGALGGGVGGQTFQLRSRGGRRSSSSLRARYRNHSVRVRHRWC